VGKKKKARKKARQLLDPSSFNSLDAYLGAVEEVADQICREEEREKRLRKKEDGESERWRYDVRGRFRRIPDPDAQDEMYS